MKKLSFLYCYFLVSPFLSASEQKEQLSISLELLSEIPLQESPDYYFFTDEKTILIATNNDLQKQNSTSSFLEGDRTLTSCDIFTGKIIDTKNETACEIGHPFDTHKHMLSPSTSMITTYNKKTGKPDCFLWQDEQKKSSYALNKEDFVAFDCIDHYRWKTSPSSSLLLYTEKGLFFPHKEIDHSADENDSVIFDFLQPRQTHVSLWQPPSKKPLFKKTSDLILIESTLDQLDKGALFLMENTISRDRSLFFVNCIHEQPYEKHINFLPLSQEKLASIKDMALINGVILLLSDKKLYGFYAKDDPSFHSIKNKTYDTPETNGDPFESLFIDPVSFNTFIKHKNNHFSFVNLKKNSQKPAYKCFELVRRKIINTIVPNTTGDTFALATTSYNSVSSTDNYNYSIAHFKINLTNTKAENHIEKIILQRQDYGEIINSPLDATPAPLLESTDDFVTIQKGDSSSSSLLDEKINEIISSPLHHPTPEQFHESPDDFVTIQKEDAFPSDLSDEKQYTDSLEKTKAENQRLAAFVTFIKTKLF